MPKKNLLIVDDDITSLDIIALLFEKKGFRVARTTGGEQAILDCKNNKPDLVIMDLMMPGVNGVEATSAIRASGFTQPIVGFTASSDPALHKDAILAGCNEILTKPCRAKALVERIECIMAEDQT
ncbi:MAG TPA: response regulator [Oligoflexia bacterium]|nr:response regulator [Oligoflexia bacterium]HMP49765.1 response regulator [Oligoflexia bacterium]